MKHGRIVLVVIFSASMIGSTIAGAQTTTTTTTLPPCTDEATFGSAQCRLDELSAAITAEAGLASIADKLENAVDIADRNVGNASDACNAADLKETRSLLKKAIRRLIQYGHRLRSLKSRNNIPPEIRTPFIDEGHAIQQDLEALRGNLVCPPASPSGAFL